MKLLEKQMRERRAKGEMVCVNCGGFSSAQTCWKCATSTPPVWQGKVDKYDVDTAFGVKTSWSVTWATGNPYSSSNIMSAEMKEQEAKQRKVEDGRPDEVKNILRKLGYNVK